CGMYVDKRLAGIQAVQTLSRLNRAHPGKDTTYVLDFVNDTEEVLAAFKTYHTRRNCRPPRTRTWSSTCAPSWMAPATTTTSRWTAWWRWNSTSTPSRANWSARWRTQTPACRQPVDHGGWTPWVSEHSCQRI